MAVREQVILAAAVSLLDGHDRAALLYSGGADSGLLLHLLRPLRARLLVVWVNAGVLPHEAVHVRATAAGGPFAEIPSDREVVWCRDGLPSFLLPAGRADVLPGCDVPLDGVRLQPPPACCITTRTNPALAFLAQHGFTLLIHGQRRGEGSGLFAPGPQPMQVWAPLARWTREEVMARVAHHGTPLPRQYREGFPETIECAVCPSNLTPARLAFLRQHAPEAHAETLRLARVAWTRVDAAGRAIAHQLREAETAVG